MSVEIKRAVEDDATLLATLGSRTFYGAYHKDNTVENMDLYLQDNFSPQKQLDEIRDQNKAFFIAYFSGVPCGYSGIRAVKPPSCVLGPKPIELYKMYIDQNILGKGVGEKLIEACLKEAQNRGFETMWLGVWEKAARARAFYKRWKFVDVGASVYRVGRDLQPDIVMARQVHQIR